MPAINRPLYFAKTPNAFLPGQRNGSRLCAYIEAIVGNL